jgi:formylglycine-generating enzyme required for sulfatase activity
MSNPLARIVLPACILLAATALSCSDKAEPPAASAAVQTITTPSGAAMVALPGGWFTMGSGAKGEKDEQPHKVYVSPFYMDQYEVAQEHFEKVLGRNPSRWKDPKNPVEHVRWTDAAEYCNARSRLEGLAPCYDMKTWACDFAAGGYRLPTEAEWEYAARAGTQTEFFFGDGPADLGQYASFKGNSTRGPSPVGTRRPNPWGLYDMLGNVWEWCNDFYQEDYYAASPDRDPRGPDRSDTRVLRGGCWNSRADKCRAAYRLDEQPVFTDACFARDVSGFVGFRCVRSRN